MWGNRFPRGVTALVSSRSVTCASNAMSTYSQNSQQVNSRRDNMSENARSVPSCAEAVPCVPGSAWPGQIGHAKNDVVPVSSTPPHLRFDRAEFDRQLEARRAAAAASPASPLSQARRDPRTPSIAERRRASECLATHLASVDVAFAALDPEQQAAIDRRIAGLPSLERTAKARGRSQPRERTPERQSQVDQMVMWGTCGLLPPDARKKFGRSIGILAVVNRIVDVVRSSGRGLCDWSVAKLAESVGVCRRTAQRAMAFLRAGKLPGMAVKTPVNCGPDRTDTNVVTLSDTEPGKRLSKWQLRNQWSGRQFGHPKEIIGILKDAIAPDTDPRVALCPP